jgi:hypothetical protein
MKFNFKIQPFQTEAVESVIRVFYGQLKQERVNYRRDRGKNIDPRTMTTNEYIRQVKSNGWEPFNKRMLITSSKIALILRSIE